MKLRDVPPNSKIITSILEMKNKANRTYRARINARCFLQFEVFHYNEANISSPITNNMSIRIIMVLAIMASWEAKILDVKGAFLCIEFKEYDETCKI